MGLIQNQFNNGSDECQAAYSGPRDAYTLPESSCSTLFFRARVPQRRGRVRQTCIASDKAKLQNMMSIFIGLTTSGTVTL